MILKFPFFGFNFNYNLITLLHAITSKQAEFFGKVKTKNWDLWKVVFLYNDEWKEEDTKDYL